MDPDLFKEKTSRAYRYPHQMQNNLTHFKRAATEAYRRAEEKGLNVQSLKCTLEGQECLYYEVQYSDGSREEIREFSKHFLDY